MSMFRDGPHGPKPSSRVCSPFRRRWRPSEVGSNGSGPRAARTFRRRPQTPPSRRLTKMLSLTEKAAEKVKEIRQAEGIEDVMALRLRVVGGGCSGFSYDLYFDSAQDSDK